MASVGGNGINAAIKTGGLVLAIIGGAVTIGMFPRCSDIQLSSKARLEHRRMENEGKEARKELTGDIRIMGADIKALRRDMNQNHIETLKAINGINE